MKPPETIWGMIKYFRRAIRMIRFFRRRQAS
jgi:hypothetical protein